MLWHQGEFSDGCHLLVTYLLLKGQGPTQTTTPPTNEEGEARRKQNQMWTFSDVSKNRKLAKHVTEYKVFDKNSIC